MTIPDNLRLTPLEVETLARIRKAARERHERARRAAKKAGRRDFPLAPYEDSWAYEESFRRRSRRA